METDSAYLLFDYYAGNTALPDLSPEKPLLVLNSHSHGDHYSQKIFSICDRHKNVRYFPDCGIPVPSVEKEKCTFLKPHCIWQIPEIRGSLYTLASNDAGVAFSLDLMDEGRNISVYHAGDLNNWWWDGDREDQESERFYHNELALIRGKHYLAACIPLDPRIKGWWKGIDDFMHAADADYIFPMHNFGNYTMPGKLKQADCSGTYRDKIADVQRPLQSWHM